LLDNCGFLDSLVGDVLQHPCNGSWKFIHNGLHDQRQHPVNSG
jgi:hypothetical protein